MSIIYCIENLSNGKCYIGQTIQPMCRRKQNHLGKLRKGTHWNKHLQAAYLKYGEANFKFIVIDSGDYNIDQLNRLEQDYIREYNSYEGGYNQTLGGYSCKRSQHTKDLMSSIKKDLYSKTNHPWKGKSHSIESKKKMSESKKGKFIPHLLKFKGSKHSQCNLTIYNWKHISGLKRQCTMYNLLKEFDLNQSHVSKLIKGTRKSHKGWSCNGKATDVIQT